MAALYHGTKVFEAASGKRAPGIGAVLLEQFVAPFIDGRVEVRLRLDEEFGGLEFAVEVFIINAVLLVLACREMFLPALDALPELLRNSLIPCGKSGSPSHRYAVASSKHDITDANRKDSEYVLVHDLRRS